MRLLERVVEKPRECAYLRDRRASLEVRLMLDVTPGEMDGLLERGWRRFGPMYFRPACRHCSECVSLRIAARSFVPNKSQRRAAKGAERLRRTVAAPSVDDARLALYAKWHAQRERRRGWDPNPQTREGYALEFAFPHPSAREAAFYDDDDGGKLVGVGLYDETPRALSAAFFYYDPDCSRLSLGTVNVLRLLDDAKGGGRDYVYLGYRVEGCASLAYKHHFRPHELLSGWPALDEDAAAAWHPPAPDGKGA
jgi:leucyl-tRNA---protein transferase